MGAIFGKSKKASRITEQDKAVLQLKQQRDKLKQYQKKIELTLERDRLLARKLLKDGKKERAKLLLRKKRYQEQLLQNTDNQLENLEKLTHDIEFAQIEIEVLEGLKTGNAALKKVHEVLNIDEIERIMDETREGVEKQQEIDAVISGTLTAEDEEAVDAEYAALVADLLPETPIAADEPISLPEVPTDELAETEVPGTSPEKEKIKLKKIAVEAS